ncbi:dihydroorotate dehydrogenase [Cystoisospora suis]|uniref:Dihydroorotate dehydrogenase (quinone), mitochondrial n=1 Tax=Cystoisospora suis TaxID=483139 RepID=A0A2C6KM99_9APIC|nr:dihydroorotate dehydrogenase [Cystoisospora suis]
MASFVAHSGRSCLLGWHARCTYTFRKHVLGSFSTSCPHMVRGNSCRLMTTRRLPPASRLLQVNLSSLDRSVPPEQTSSFSLFLREGLFFERRSVSSYGSPHFTALTTCRSSGRTEGGAVRGRGLASSPLLGVYVHLRHHSTVSGGNRATSSAAAKESSSTPPPYGGIPAKHINPEEVERLVSTRAAAERKSNRLLVLTVILLGVGVYTYYGIQDVSSSLYSLYEPCTSFLFSYFNSIALLNPETAHHYAIEMAKRGWVPADYDREEQAMNVEIGGLRFFNPIGLAAGFDKHAEAPAAFLKMGFGFVEVGSITPEPQPGNPSPRLFRLVEDRGIINRFGFNSKGADHAQKRLEEFAANRWKDPIVSNGVLGVNLGKNKTSEDAVGDAKVGVRKLARYADYLVINLSSPNTPGLRSLQQKSHLTAIIDGVHEELNELDKHAHRQGEERREGTSSSSSSNPSSLSIPPSSPFYLNQTGKRPLLFVKIAPDLSMEEKQSIAEVALEKKIGGLIVTNTTIQRPESLRSCHKTETGGLSGRPLRELSTACVADMYALTGGKVPIIASGGVESGADALAKIEAGASLVEIYTSMIYKGPQVVRNIKNELYSLLNSKGYPSVAAAVGQKHRGQDKKVKKVLPPRFD